MDYIVTNKNDIIGKVSLENFPGHLATDLLIAVTRGEPKGDDGDDTSINYNKMRVGSLRKMFLKKGLMWMVLGRQLLHFYKKMLERKNKYTTHCYVYVGYKCVRSCN